VYAGVLIVTGELGADERAAIARVLLRRKGARGG
jgi:hypothetical protein